MKRKFRDSENHSQHISFWESIKEFIRTKKITSAFIFIFIVFLTIYIFVKKNNYTCPGDFVFSTNGDGTFDIIIL